MILWIDFETTGLVAHKGFILEAAWFFTSEDCSTRRTQPRQMLFNLPPLRRRVRDAAVREMHERSGLLAEIREQPTYRIQDLERQLLTDFDQLGLGTGYVYLGGSNCDFERRWIEYHVPRVAPFLSHRALDVSRLRTAFRFWTGETYAQPERRHRALDDVEDHFQEALYYRSRLLYMGK